MESETVSSKQFQVRIANSKVFKYGRYAGHSHAKAASPNKAYFETNGRKRNKKTMTIPSVVRLV
jgi:hypothetical protein